MIALLISILWFILYAGLFYGAALLVLYFVEQMKGSPISPRARQICLAVVGILIVIWGLTILAGGATVQPPWAWRLSR